MPACKYLTPVPSYIFTREANSNTKQIMNLYI